MVGPLIKNAAQAALAAQSLRRRALAFVSVLILGGVLAQMGGICFATAVGAFVWGTFALFTLIFFRDPTPHVPAEGEAVVAPAHGRVDCVEECVEPEFIGGPCRRISIFLSIIDVHVQNAPVAGKIIHLQRRPGQFLSALRTESAQHNESVLIGMECAGPPSERVAVRQIAGVIARRVLTWVKPADVVARSERIGLIQFGSRCDLYLPLAWRLVVMPGDKVHGGETIVARRGEATALAQVAPTQSPP
jgi:phosphatidylserine decarboxylase